MGGGVGARRRCKTKTVRCNCQGHKAALPVLIDFFPKVDDAQPATACKETASVSQSLSLSPRLCACVLGHSTTCAFTFSRALKMHLRTIRGPDIPISSVPVYSTGAESVWDSQAV